MPDPAHPLPEPIDSHEGIPDSAPTRPAWKYILLGAAFLAWLGVLAGLFLLGRG